MKPPAPVRDVSPERKALYYAGMVVGVLGVLLFASNFLVVAAGFGGPGAMVGDGGRIMLRAFGGMALLVIGRGMTAVAARGLAGSGLVLDPGRARRDMEPWSRMGGGMVQDALDEVPTVGRAVDRLASGADPAEVVRVRCRSCRALNDEHDKFCGQCGQPL